MQWLIMWRICIHILSCSQITSSSQIMSNLEQLTAQFVAFCQKVIESGLLKKFFSFDIVLNHISPVHMPMSSYIPECTCRVQHILCMTAVHITHSHPLSSLHGLISRYLKLHLNSTAQFVTNIRFIARSFRFI